MVQKHLPSPNENVLLCEKSSRDLLCIQRIWSYFLGCAETGHYPNWQKSRRAVFPNENRTTALWNVCAYVIPLNCVIAHFPGAQNTAADYLSRLKAYPKDKLVMKIRGDVQTLPIEINVQSAGVSQEEQIFYTIDDG